MRVQVIFASFLMLTISLAGCITDSTVEQITDDITEVLGCMDESALNFDESATTSSDLCLSEEQLLLAEEVFWSSWDSDAINNATEPVGYRLMLEEKSENGNSTHKFHVIRHGLVVQEVFAPDYYDQEFEYRSGIFNNTDFSNLDAKSCDVEPDDEWSDLYVQNCQYSSQTVFDNVVQVEKYSGEINNNTIKGDVGGWNNYSMDTASTYEEFRNRLEHGPGIRSSSDWSNNTMYADTSARDENGSDESNDMPMRAFPGIADTEFNNTVFSNLDVSIGAEGRSQTIYYFARDTSTGNEIEVMGEMTENGFKITEYCNEIPNTNLSIIDSFMGTNSSTINMDESGQERDEEDAGAAGTIENMTVTTDGPWRFSARIILLEVDGNEMRFEEYDYDEPVNYRSENQSQDGVVLASGFKAIPFYFEVIPDSDANETQNKSAEGRKGLNAVNVKVVIAGPSGPFGMEGDLSDYRLVISNCTLDSKTTDSSNNTITAARSGNDSLDGGSPPIYGSDGNTCTDLIEYDLAAREGLNGSGFRINRSQGGGPSIIFVDADSSGTLSEGDRFEFSDNNTIFDDANMLRLFSISADGYSDENINPSSEMSAVHEGAMNSIRNIRAVAPDDPPPPVRCPGQPERM